ncbi:STAS domain-containing protein [Streptomyces californicus]|uniref:STAS domain-containing protein n=1 Tax=Streptomyces californicus TaxID=67351 RepID=UPI003699635F
MSTVLETVGDGVVLIRVRGSLDGWDGTAELTEALAAAANGGGRLTVVDLSGVEFADSTALHALLDGRREHDDAGKRLVAAGPLSVNVRRLFEVTGTLDAFRFTADVETAIAG